MFAPVTTRSNPPLSHAGSHEWDAAQEGGSAEVVRPLRPKHNPEDETAAKVEGAARQSRGTHTTTPEKRGSTHTPVKGRSMSEHDRSLDEPPRQFGRDAPVSRSPDASDDHCTLATAEHYDAAGDDRPMRASNVLTDEGKAATKQSQVADVQPGAAAPKTKEYVPPSLATKLHGRADILIGKITRDSDLKLKGQLMQRGEATKAAEVGK